MARSSYVYVVMGREVPIAAFTVKHELVTWLKGWSLAPFCAVYRLRARDHEQEQLDVQELLAS